MYLCSPSSRLSSPFSDNRPVFSLISFCWQALKKMVGLLLILIMVSAVDVYAQEQKFPMEEFIGVNTLREDPIEYLDCAGFVREYHDWVIDEGDIYQNLDDNTCSPDYPNNQYRWNPGYQGQSSERFDDFYSSILNEYLDVDLVEGEPRPICADMKFCLPRLAGGNYTQRFYEEFKPVLTNLSVPDINPGSPPLGNNSAPITVTLSDPNLTKKPASYEHFSDWVYQFNARYGEENNCATGNEPECSSLKYNDKTTGLNYVGYIEIWNEQDKTWFNHIFTEGSVNMIQFEPEEYAAMASAALDGHCNTVQGDLPGQDNAYSLGVNRTKTVFGGLSEISEGCWEFVQGVHQWCKENRKTNMGCNKVFPFDVLNFHHYSDGVFGVDISGANPAVMPEADAIPDNPDTEDINEFIPTFKERLRDLKKLINEEFENGEELELWLSEFGYDTNDRSPQRAPIIEGNEFVSDQQEVQGQWMVRSYLEIAAADWDRAMMYSFADADSDPNQGLFQGSGLVKDKASNSAPKKSYYYVYTMKEVLRGTKFENELTGGGNEYGTNPEHPRIYQFDGNFPNGTTKRVYAVWIPTAENNTNASFPLEINFPAGVPQEATLVTMESGDVNGIHTPLAVLNNGGNQGVQIPISERPVFVILGVSETEATLPCPQNITATGVSCDALHVEWTIPSNTSYDHYNVYYYDKNDLDELTLDEGGELESVVPEFNIGDSHWRLAASDFDGDCTEVVISGLNRVGDNYYVYIQGVGIDANDNEIYTQGNCQAAGRTAICSGHIPPEVFLSGNSNTDIADLFDYSTVSFCHPQQEPVIQDAEGEIVEGINVPFYTEILTFEEDYILNTIDLYDMNGKADYVIEFDTDLEGDDFQNLVTYFTDSYQKWISIPLGQEGICNTPIRRLRLKHQFFQSQIGKMVLYGHPANAPYPLPDCCQLFSV